MKLSNEDYSWLKLRDIEQLETIIFKHSSCDENESICLSSDSLQPIGKDAAHEPAAIPQFPDVDEPANSRTLKFPQDYALHLFRRSKNWRKYPKKENIRLAAIRKFTKILKILRNRLKRRKLERNLQANGDSWQAFITLVQICEECGLKGEALPVAGSAPYLKGRRRKIPAHASYNDEFCRVYFGMPGVLRSYRQFIEFFFTKTIDDLSKELNIACCEGRHSRKCDTKWLKMKTYLQSDILQELGIDIPVTF